jgi:hypothetical protein
MGSSLSLSKMPREPAMRNTCHGPRTSLPQRTFHPTDHVQDIHPTDNPPPSAQKSGAGEARSRVGRRRVRLPSSNRQSLRALVMQSSAPAPGAPSPWDSALGVIEDSISQCTFLQITYLLKTRTQMASPRLEHAHASARPAAATPASRPPHPQQQDGGKTDILSVEMARA